MEGGILIDSELCGNGGHKIKRSVKEDSPKRSLADITNFQQQQRQKPLNQQAKQQCAPLAADNSIDQLLKENATLMKLLASRNAVLESCKAQIHKCQTNFQRLRKQNLELAQANSQMLAELNTSRQKQRELQLELGTKNGILKALQLELKEIKHTEKLARKIDINEVGTSHSNWSDQMPQADNRVDNHCHAKRKRVSKSQTSAPAVCKLAKSTEKTDKQRYSLRRISTLQENPANENRPTSLGATVKDETREQDTETSGPTTTEQVNFKENLNKKRHSLRRESARFKPDNPEPTEEDTKNPGPTTTEQVHFKENIKKRHSLRRQSVRLKPENPEPTEDFFEIDDAKYAAPHSCDENNMAEQTSLTTSIVTFGQDNKEKTASQEIPRSSVGRPLRRTVGKVQSYKEIPLNVKMRRPD